MPSKNRFQKLCTRLKAGLRLIYYRDRMTGAVFAIVK